MNGTGAVRTLAYLAIMSGLGMVYYGLLGPALGTLIVGGLLMYAAHEDGV